MGDLCRACFAFPLRGRWRGAPDEVEFESQISPYIVKFQFVDQRKYSGEPMTKHMANIVTGFRILGSVLLLIVPAFSAAFYGLYLLCGFSDMIDGAIARKTNSTGEWGAKIDTAADLAFAAVSLMKILPTLHVPPWLWLWGGVIAAIKVGNLLWGYVLQKEFVSPHTILNKITGALLFLLPLTLSFVEWKYSSVAVCSIATLAAIHEGAYIAKI